MTAPDRLETAGGAVSYHSLERAAGAARLEQLPYVIRIFIENVEPEFRDRFLSAQQGELVGPLARGDEFLLYLVLAKVRPSRHDAHVAARAEDAIVRRLDDQAINDRVKWHCRF